MKSVLVVEDDKDIRDNMIALLENEGYSIYSAIHGAEALEILRDKTVPLPGLIALDFYMPVMDARVFLQELAKEQLAGLIRPVPIVLITAADSSARKGLEGQTLDLLRKPIDIDAFLQIVQKNCG